MVVVVEEDKKQHLNLKDDLQVVEWCRRYAELFQGRNDSSPQHESNQYTVRRAVCFDKQPIKSLHFGK